MNDLSKYVCPLFIVAAMLCSMNDARAIDFHDSLQEAMAATENPRPVVISFGAPWCGWCRKMESDTFADPKLDGLAEQFVWVKVDVDEQQEIAARFQVHAVPQTIVLDEKGRILGSKGGYLSTDKLIAFLDESLKNPHPEELLPDLLARLEQPATDEERRDVVTQVVESLARPEREQREELLASLQQQGETVWPALFELTADERLAIRAAAAGALKHVTAAELPFHPFADASQREQQRAAWQKWLDEHRDVKNTPDA